MTLMKCLIIQIGVLFALNLAQTHELHTELVQTQHQLAAAELQLQSPHIDNSITPSVDPKSQDCLAKNIYYEARGESDMGKIAVARVTINRAKQTDKSVCGVVFERQTPKTCQFSWTCSKKRAIIADNESWNSCVAIAHQILAYDSYNNVVKDATYYHATNIHPNWSAHMIKVGRVDNQIFYKEKI